MRPVVAGFVFLACFGKLCVPAWGENARLSLADATAMQASLGQAIRPCLAQLPGQAAPQSATVRLYFNRDGTLERRPGLISATSVAMGANLVRASIRCLARKGAVRFDERSYEAWKVMQLKWTL